MKRSVFVLAALLAACGGGNNDSNSANNDPNNTANNANNGSNNANNTANNANNTANNTNANNTTPPNNGAGLILPCEDLTFNDSCSNPMAAAGYPACSDYFGESSNQNFCGTVNPMAMFSDQPCQPYEFYVGSCIYYTDALPNACYITHVGADSADLIQAGRDFWAATCANWVEGP